MKCQMRQMHAHVAMATARELLLCEVMDNTHLRKHVYCPWWGYVANCNSVSSEILQLLTAEVT